MSTDTLDPVFQAAGQRFGIDPDLLRAQAHVESNFNPQAVSPKGAIGLMQMMPDTAKALGIDPTDPAQSIFGAASLIRQNLDRYQGNLEAAVAAYHGGTDPQNWGPLTQSYVGKVADTFQGLKNSGAMTPTSSAGPGDQDPVLAALSGSQHAPQGGPVQAPPNDPYMDAPGLPSNQLMTA
ncbi:MAG: lytic transglycosylase domain-containing protein [Paucibacter sp.]|nr:lytic transglycosylase domain-containing protein [Roseateles sp.]